MINNIVITPFSSLYYPIVHISLPRFTNALPPPQTNTGQTPRSFHHGTRPLFGCLQMGDLPHSLFFPENPFQSPHAFHTKNGEPTILESLGQPEEYHPQSALEAGADGQGHLCERQYIEGYAREQDQHPRAKRQAAEPGLDTNKHLFHRPSCFFKSRATALSTSAMSCVGSKRATTHPLRSTRNLVKFHLMSDLAA